MAEVIGSMLGFIGMDVEWARRLLTGIIELTSGVWSLRGVSGELTASIAMAAFMLGWAGLSVHCQVLSFIGSSGLSVRTYIIGKFLHGILSAIIVLIIARIVAFDTPVAVYLAQQLGDIAEIKFSTELRVSAISAAVLGGLLFLISVLPGKKSGKPGGKAV